MQNGITGWMLTWTFWSSLALAGGCSEPRCPKGYYQVGNSCHRPRDAGTDAIVGEGEDGDGDTSGEVDSGEDDPSRGANADLDAGARVDGSPTAHDANATIDEAAASDGGERTPVLTCGSEGCGANRECILEGDAAVCRCAAGRTACDADCVDLDADPMNCGECGYRCDTGLGCKQGMCEQRIRELVVGGGRSCALYNAPDGAYPVKCWGATASRLFRDGAPEALSPRSIVGVPTARMIALSHYAGGAEWQCIVPSNRDLVRCWGGCGLACGNSQTPATGDAFHDNEAPAVVALATGGPGTCVLNAVGVPSCWGETVLMPHRAAKSVPEEVYLQGGRPIRALGVGGVHGCAINGEKHVVCWGGNSSNQLGSSASLPATGAAGLVVTMEGGGELTGVSKLDVGAARSCAVTEQGELWCWGNNSLGSLGVGDRIPHVGAVRLGLNDVDQVTAGVIHSCAIVRGGQAYCWGLAPLLGLGPDARGDAESGTYFTRPQPLPDLPDAVEIRAALEHTCARRRSGQVTCWGENKVGQIGDGTTISRLRPVAVIGL